jgi:hypothetical protein
MEINRFLSYTLHHVNVGSTGSVPCQGSGGGIYTLTGALLNSSQDCLGRFQMVGGGCMKNHIAFGAQFLDDFGVIQITENRFDSCNSMRTHV